jgi:predicted extracellular nuclease
MTWNTENFFDPKPPHPSSPKPPDSTTYKRWLRKAAATIAAAGNPTVIALQEVENIAVLEDIASQELLQGYDYQPYLLEGSDSRGIDVGYLVRGDQVEVIEVYQRNAPEGLTSRPPLVLHLNIDEQNVYVINNHFTSMSGGESITEPRRLKQAEWNVQIMQEILDEDPQAEIVIVGDLNSFYDSAPIQALRDAGLRPVFEKLPLEQRYTYIYQGEAQVLDYILVTDNLWRRLHQVEILHVNADWPPPSEEDTSPRRKSDHDPVIAIFKR